MLSINLTLSVGGLQAAAPSHTSFTVVGASQKHEFSRRGLSPVTTIWESAAWTGTNRLQKDFHKKATQNLFISRTLEIKFIHRGFSFKQNSSTTLKLSNNSLKCWHHFNRSLKMNDNRWQFKLRGSGISNVFQYFRNLKVFRLNFVSCSTKNKNLSVEWKLNSSTLEGSLLNVIRRCIVCSECRIPPIFVRGKLLSQLPRCSIRSIREREQVDNVLLMRRHSSTAPFLDQLNSVCGDDSPCLG